MRHLVTPDLTYNSETEGRWTCSRFLRSFTELCALADPVRCGVTEPFRSSVASPFHFAGIAWIRAWQTF